MTGGDDRGDENDRGLLGRLRDWLGSLFGGEADAEAGEATAAAAVCTVCGTEVADPASGCPLCGSTDVRPRGGESAADPPKPGDDESAGLDPERRSVAGTTDDAVTRLRDVRGGEGSDGSAGDTDDGGSAGDTDDGGSAGDTDDGRSAEGTDDEDPRPGDATTGPGADRGAAADGDRRAGDG